MPAHADAHDAVIHHPRIDHLVRCSVAFDAEALHFSRGKFIQQKDSALLVTQGGTRVVFETRRAIRVIRQRRQEIRRLPRVMRPPQSFTHPGAVFFHILKMIPPAAVARLRQIDKPLPLAPHVGVVVHRKEIAKGIERRLLRIAVTAHVHFEIRPVGLDPHDRAFVGIRKVPALARGDVQAFVADAPIDAPVRTHRESVHVVARIGDVHTETVHHHFANVRHAVIVRILESPEIGRDRRINPAVMIHHARRDPGYLGVKSVGENGHCIRRSITIGVTELIDTLGVMRQILPVDGAVTVVILQTGPRQPHLSRSEFAMKKRLLVGHAGESDIVGNPHRVFANIEIAHLAARRGRNVNAALWIDRTRDWIGDVERTGPFVEHQLAGRGTVVRVHLLRCWSLSQQGNAQDKG